MGLFSNPFAGKSNKELLELRNTNLQIMEKPQVNILQKGNGLIAGGLIGMSAYLQRDWMLSKVGTNGFATKAVKAISSVPGAAMVGLATIGLMRVHSRWDTKMEANINVNAINKELSQRTGHSFGLEAITQEDLDKMKNADGQAIGAHTAKATAQSAATTHQR